MTKKHSVTAAASLIAGLAAAFAGIAAPAQANDADLSNLAPLPLDLPDIGDGSFKDLDKMIES
ncbi:hypothetical protein [Streptomyces hypolithicus]